MKTILNKYRTNFSNNKAWTVAVYGDAVGVAQRD